MTGGAVVMFQPIRVADGVVDATRTSDGAVDLGYGEEIVVAAVNDAERARSDQAGKIPDFTPPHDAWHGIAIAVMDESGLADKTGV